MKEMDKWTERADYSSSSELLLSMFPETSVFKHHAEEFGSGLNEFFLGIATYGGLTGWQGVMHVMSAEPPTPKIDFSRLLRSDGQE
jgi:hypothetical protein